MSLYCERIVTKGIAQISYLIGDDDTGTAAVIDPRPDVDIYLELAREHSLAITHIFETHVHADFMSGARELADRVRWADIYLSKEGGASYGFNHKEIKDGDTLECGSVILTAHHTPGHTPEHISYMIAEKRNADSPWGIFTGDSLFVGSAGRPDLLGEEMREDLVEQLFGTLRDFYLKLDDHVIIYPCHGAGSACGASIGDRPSSTIGYERRFNPFLQYDNFEEFKEFVISGAPPEPAHYSRLKKINANGPEILRGLPTVPELQPKKFREAIDNNESILLDTRQMLAFGGGHIKGAINIGDRPELSVWAGSMLDSARPLLLVLEGEANREKVLRLLLHTGFTTFTGYLVGGMKEWDNAGFPIEKIPQMSVHELKEKLRNNIQILDVRSPGEWERGHIPGAIHKYVADMRIEIDCCLDKDKPIAVYCDSGYRASIAASLLKSRGIKDVYNVPGSWQAWTNMGYPIERSNN